MIFFSLTLKPPDPTLHPTPRNGPETDPKKRPETEPNRIKLFGGGTGRGFVGVGGVGGVVREKENHEVIMFAQNPA